jgi:hyperosmotically inducible periplasmic protein
MKALYSAALMVGALALMTVGVPAFATKTDDRIESSAKKSYVFKTYLKDDDIKITSTNGAVALTGSVDSESHKALAQETVAGQKGVKSVDNKLEVQYASPGSPAEKDDMWLSTKVKTVLLFNRNVSGMTEVNTKDGMVTLRGDASSQAEKDLTTEYAKDVDGVKGVTNDMTVTNPSNKTAETTWGKIDDASITSQVKMSLLYHRSTSAISTSVTTKRGVVTLTGQAKNAAEKDLVSKLVNDIKGVKSVKNRMTIS